MLRSLGSTSFTTRPPIAISPSVMVSRPAIMRSSVDLPQPEGPTITMNSPSAIVDVTPWITRTSLRVALLDVLAGRSRPFYFSVSTRPFTNHFCMRITTSAGGSIASIAVAMMRFHSLVASPPAIMRLMPITTVYIDSVAGDEERPEVLVPAEDEEDHEERRHVGLGKRQHHVPEEAHRPRAVDARRLGELVGDGEEELAEEEGRRGRGDERQREARRTNRAGRRSDATLKVGMMRTSIGSISVTKIIQKKKLRSGKRK